MKFNIMHFPGSSTKHIKENRILFDRLLKRKNLQKFTERVTILLVNNYKSIQPLEKFVKTNCFNYHIEKANIKHWKNNIKIDLIKKSVKNIKTEYVLYLDTSDTFVINDIKLIEKFETFQCDMLLNSTYNFAPYHNSYTYEDKEFQEKITNKKNKYLNTGAFLSRTEFLKEFINNVYEMKSKTKELKEIEQSFTPYNSNIKIVPRSKVVDRDQFSFNRLFRKYHPQVKLDYDRKIFALINYGFTPKLFLG